MAYDVEKPTSMTLSHVRWGEASESVDKILQNYLVDAWVTRCLHKYMEKSFYKDMNYVCNTIVRCEFYGLLTTAGISEADNWLSLSLSVRVALGTCCSIHIAVGVNSCFACVKGHRTNFMASFHGLSWWYAGHVAVHLEADDA
jgi:hypothetical protein